MLFAIDIDNDLTEIFVEEASGIFKTMDRLLPDWRKLPTNGSAISEIRRSFHTLKGSGRMVKALDLAEVAWKVENVLNRVIDGSVRVTFPVVELVSNARDLLPQMLDAFKNHRSMESDRVVEALIAQADALAADPAPVPASAQPSAVNMSPGGKQSPALDLVTHSHRLDRIQKRSDEALHRSEMALQHARRFGTYIIGMKEATRDQVGREELGSILEQIDLLSGELRGLQHQRGHLECQLGEARREAAASRRLVKWSLLLSALSGAGAIAALVISGLPVG